MKVLCLMLLGLVVVTGSRMDRNTAEKVLLEEIIESIDDFVRHPDTQSKSILGMFVKDQAESCSKEALCRAGHALKEIPMENNKLQRQLLAYAHYTTLGNCSVSNADESMVKDFLQKVKACSREQYANILRHKHHPK
ncbi:hypothetical protein DNTS_012139 [Danionella cerebrum]|uniref:Interleukin-4 n=1 Tax=Danionella cerebrum TaxID=2873325 RepID=A0A553PUD9_9TELE|nr:hypothetical protein DNTS_012139 [Danionella translucida]